MALRLRQPSARAIAGVLRCIWLVRLTDICYAVAVPDYGEAEASLMPNL